MGHNPHLYIGGAWDDPVLLLSSAQIHHLERVLRIRPGSPVTYTDGRGRVGHGSYRGSEVARGEESTVGRPNPLTLAVAPPASRERCRFMVEKLSEIGVSGLYWLETRRGEGKVPSPDRLQAWAVGALEQSRGAWLIDVGTSMVTWDQLKRPLTVAAPGGSPRPIEMMTIAIGPEGGWEPGEVPADAGLVDLGPTTLRVETAALVAATRFGPWQGA